jgi:hypothetical protein
LAVCRGSAHAWGRWLEGEVADGAGWYVGGRGGNEEHRKRSAGTQDEPWTEVPDWALISAYQHLPPSRLRTELRAAVKAIGILPVHKSTSFETIVRWAMDELPEAAPNHPRAAEAKAMATFYWRYR